MRVRASATGHIVDRITSQLSLQTKGEYSGTTSGWVPHDFRVSCRRFNFVPLGSKDPDDRVLGPKDHC